MLPVASTATTATGTTGGAREQAAAVLRREPTLPLPFRAAHGLLRLLAAMPDESLG